MKVVNKGDQMNEKLLNYYRQFSTYTNPGCYLDYLRNDLPNDIREIGSLVRQQLIHRSSLANGNTGTNADLKYGDLTKIPWYRQAEDDIFPTVSAMVAELFRRDPKGFALNRNPEDKLILTCRFVSILMASILKAKGIPARVRSGFASYFVVEGFPAGKSDDHWINQYWSEEQSRWVTIDVDGMHHDYTKLNFYDLPEEKFDFSADAWIKVREGKINESHFHNACGTEGLMAIAWELFYDFHCLMNDEIIYLHIPKIVSASEFKKLDKEQLKGIDDLAVLMQKPDKNLEELKKIWKAKKEYRLMTGGLL